MGRRHLVVILLLTLQACASAQSPTRKVRVLFIGNSYTYVNELPYLFSQLAASTPRPKQVDAEMVVAGGATLQRLWDEGNALRALRQGHWDFVVLQEQSTLGDGGVINGIAQINDPKAFHESARLFDSEIRKAGARTVFFLTWARQNSPEWQSKLNSAYGDIARELDALLAPVGPAWQRALHEDPKLLLYLGDKSHPTPAGSYLAACVFYAVMFGESPAGASNRLAGRPVDAAGRPIASESRLGGILSSPNRAELVSLSATQASFLQSVAWQTVQEFKVLARIAQDHRTSLPAAWIVPRGCATAHRTSSPSPAPRLSGNAVLSRVDLRGVHL